MKVSQLVTQKKVITISASKSVSELIKLLSDNRIGAVVVSENGSDIKGIVSERDIVRRLNVTSDFSQLSVSELMTRDVQVCRSDDSVASVMQSMTDGRFRHCPVVDSDGKLTSIVSIGDVVKAYISEIAAERDALNSYITN